jgi:hypothetical protein
VVYFERNEITKLVYTVYFGRNKITNLVYMVYFEIFKITKWVYIVYLKRNKITKSILSHAVLKEVNLLDNLGHVDKLSPFNTTSPSQEGPLGTRGKVMELTIMFSENITFMSVSNVLACPLDKVWISFQTPHNLDLCDDTCKGNLTTNVQQTLDI